MLSPVWLTVNGKKMLEIPTHDIKEDWIKKVKKNNEDLKRTIFYLPK